MYFFLDKYAVYLGLNVDFNPLKMVYVVNDQESLILSCSWNVPKSIAKMIIQHKTDDGRWLELNQPDRIQIQYWEIESKFNGIELRFSESDAGSFGLYRCASLIHNENSSGMLVFGYGFTFVISIEGIMREIQTTEEIITYAFLIIGRTTEIGNDRPIIRPAVDFLVFLTESTFDLSCEIGSGWNVTWQISSPSGLGEKKDSRKFTHYTQSENGRITVATLTIEEASYLDTGYYTCQRSDNNKNFAAKQFVFVKGNIISY